MKKVTVKLNHEVSEKDLLHHAYIGAQTLFDYCGKSSQKASDPKEKKDYADMAVKELHLMDALKDAIDCLETGRWNV